MPNENTSALLVTDTTVLSTGHLKKTGEEYSLVKLSVKNVDQIFALEDIAFANLTKEEETYLLYKDRAFFEKHFANDNDVLGIVHNGKLIAQSIIVNPTAVHPKTGMESMGLKDVPLDTLTILQGVIVDPAYRGNNLMGVMMDAWLASSAKSGRTEVLAEIIPGNTFSWSVFMKKGLHLESIGIDPLDNSEVYNMHGHLPSLSSIFNECAKKVLVPQTDIAAQKKLLSDGYKGTKFDPANGNLEFRKPKKNVHCL